MCLGVLGDGIVVFIVTQSPAASVSKPRPRLFLFSSSSPRLFIFPLPSCSFPLLPVMFPPVYLFLFKLRLIFTSWLNVSTLFVGL